MNGRLYKSIVYEIGPIDRTPIEDASGWREYVTREMFARGIGVINPLDKPTENQETEEWRDSLSRYKGLGLFHHVYDEVSDIVKEDMRFVDISHFMIYYMDMEANPCGSWMESMHAAAYQKKPVLTVCKQGRENMPNWWLGVNPPEFNFDSFAELIQYIDYVNDLSNDPDTLGRWKFIDMKKVYGEN